MHLIQILLPLYNNDNQLFPAAQFAHIKATLTEKFGGLTTYARSPATGLWKEDEVKTVKDEIVIYEIMTDAVETDWWQSYKQTLEKQFQQDEIVIRSWPIRLV